jgi:hypothetical protein
MSIYDEIKYISRIIFLLMVLAYPFFYVAYSIKQLNLGWLLSMVCLIAGILGTIGAFYYTKPLWRR